MIVFFFFQAEDGIRDTSVTGVQTCALPICRARLPRRRDRSMADMRTIATAWESRATETNNYTAAAAGHALGGAVALSDLDNYLAPTYVRLIPHKDGWSHDFFVSADKNWGVSGSKDYMIE